MHALIRMDYDFNRDVPTEGTVDPSVTNSTLQAKAKESLKLVYKQEIKRHVNRKLDYLTNKIKAYGFLIEQCNKAMVAKIKQHTNFTSTILNNPIKLLKTIKEISLNYEETKHPM